MGAGIIAFFTALPAFLNLISQLGFQLQRLINYAQQNNLNGWIDDLEKAIDQLEKAQTPQDRFDAAQFLVNTVRGNGPK